MEAAIIASIVAAISSAVFTWLFNLYAYRQKRRAVRALVWSEILQNVAILRNWSNSLTLVFENASDMREVMRLLHSMDLSVTWQHTRWDLPDVGETFTPEEIARLAEWHFLLDGISRFYEGIVRTLEQSQRPGSNVKDEAVQAFESALRFCQERINTLIDEAPSVPDRYLEPSREVKAYVKDLLARYPQGQQGSSAPPND